MFLSGKKGGLNANVRKDFMETDVKIALMRRSRMAVTISLNITFLLTVGFCIDCSRYSFFHDVSGENGNENVSW